MPIETQQRCYCNVTRRWFTPRRTEHGWGACPYCTAYRQTGTIEPDYRQPHPQWHPLLDTVQAAELRARLMQEAAAA
jgi:hypothetical protein